MKKRFFFVAIWAIFISSCAEPIEPENPYKNGIHISSNTDFTEIDLGDLDTIHGNVIIINSDIEQLDFLSNVKVIKGILGITNSRIQGLSHLSKLESVETLNFSFCYGIKDLNDLAALQVSESFIMYQNDIQQIPEMPNMTSLENFSLDEEGLQNFDVLRHLHTIEEEMALVNLYHLSNLDLLENLESIGTELIIQNNFLLKDFCGIKKALENSPNLTLTVSNNAENPGYDDILSFCN